MFFLANFSSRIKATAPQGQQGREEEAAHRTGQEALGLQPPLREVEQLPVQVNLIF